jgi:myo-inositol-1(or 4)-monophosphatase
LSVATITRLARDTAVEAADLLRRAIERDDLVVSTKSTGTDMVSEMDEASERLIVDRLLGARPDDGMLGEEGTDIEGTSGVRWIVDPLDGTTNYLYGHTGCNVSIAAEIDGRLEIGVVVDIVANDVFVGVRGEGATRNRVSLPQLPGPPALAEALVATGFGYEPVRRTAQAELLGRIIGQVRDVRRMGAAATDLCSVAAGRVDAYYERGLAAWDHSAGSVIAAACGARVTGLDQPDPSDDFVVAAHPALHGPLTELLLAHGASSLP